MNACRRQNPKRILWIKERKKNVGNVIKYWITACLKEKLLYGATFYLINYLLFILIVNETNWMCKRVNFLFISCVMKFFLDKAKKHVCNYSNEIIWFMNKKRGTQVVQHTITWVFRSIWDKKKSWDSLEVFMNESHDFIQKYSNTSDKKWFGLQDRLS